MDALGNAAMTFMGSKSKKGRVREYLWYVCDDSGRKL